MAEPRRLSRWLRHHRFGDGNPHPVLVIASDAATSRSRRVRRQLPEALMCFCASDEIMRTTVELPDDLVRELKVRAALEGRSMKSLMRALLEQGLRRSADVPTPRRQRSALPVVRTGVPFGLAAPTNAELFALLDAQA